jgi:hypothetical protein
MRGPMVPLRACASWGAVIDMNATLVKALLGLAPALALLLVAAILFVRDRSLATLLQLFGAVGLLSVVITHLCEALELLAWMHWGEPHSVGHYVDLVSAVLGLTLLPLGFVLHIVAKRQARAR